MNPSTVEEHSPRQLMVKGSSWTTAARPGERERAREVSVNEFQLVSHHVVAGPGKVVKFVLEVLSSGSEVGNLVQV